MSFQFMFQNFAFQNQPPAALAHPWLMGAGKHARLTHPAHHAGRAIQMPGGVMNGNIIRTHDCPIHRVRIKSIKTMMPTSFVQQAYFGLEKSALGEA